jgi:hypothetical protein
MRLDMGTVVPEEGVCDESEYGGGQQGLEGGWRRESKLMHGQVEHPHWDRSQIHDQSLESLEV